MGVREGRGPVAVEEEVWTYMKRSVAPKEDWPSAETIRIDRVLELCEHRHSMRHIHTQRNARTYCLPPTYGRMR